MKKEEFVKLGIDEETAKKCEAASQEELKGFIPKTRFDEVNNEKKKLELDLRDRDGQLETLKNSTGDVEAMKQQIATLQADNKAKDEAHAKEMTQLKIDAAVEKALTDGGAKNIKAVKALLDLADAKLSDDGTIKGLSEQIDKLKADEGSKFLFNATESKVQQQTFTGFQPGAATTIPDSKQAGYEARLAEARKNGNQLEVISIKQEAFNDGGIVLI